MADAAGRERVVVTEGQRRHFAVLAVLLEEMLGELEEFAAGAEAPGRLVTRQHDLPPGFGELLAPAATRVRDRLARLAAILELESRERSDARLAYALLLTNVVRIEDATSAKISGYGEVHESVARVVDPLLGDIHHDLSALAARLRDPPSR